MFELTNKNIIVTGSNGLIGREMIKYLNLAGANAIGFDIRHDTASDRNIICDITSEESVKKCIEQVDSQFGKIAGWVNNAYPRTADWGKPIEEVTMDSWRTNVDLHLNSYFMCSRMILEYMKKFNAGCVINMASIYGMQAPDFTVYNGTNMTSAVGYSAIKGGILNLTRYLAAHYGKYNLRVNALSPGGIFDNQAKPFVDNYEAKVPLKRMGRVADIAPSINFLLSDEASYITGHNLVIDGGWTIV